MKKQIKNTLLKGKKRIALAFAGCILLTTLFPNEAIAQFTLDEEVSFVYINGTSTLHDWTASVEKMKGNMQAEVKGNLVAHINSVKISIPVTSLKSSKEAMDKNMYETLKSDSYPEIIFQLKSYTIQNGTITVKGELTIAGVTKNIETKVTQLETGKHIKINGSVKLKMSDFNVKPPEFLFGAFKTGDEMTITFYFMFCEEH